MKITLTDNTMLRLPFPGCCVGYRAIKLELERSDIRAMQHYAHTDPEQLIVCLAQLEHRLPFHEHAKINDALSALEQARAVTSAYEGATKDAAAIASPIKHAVRELEK